VFHWSEDFKALLTENSRETLELWIGLSQTPDQAKYNVRSQAIVTNKDILAHLAEVWIHKNRTLTWNSSKPFPHPEQVSAWMKKKIRGSQLGTEGFQAEGAQAGAAESGEDEYDSHFGHEDEFSTP
jgi:hypothetical protein